ncbi:MAG: hypothetical protein FJ037_05205 [Chloroflexi bacterium]|nr:hypothetical protein [Chloroflexota bacterium]
MHAAPDGIHVLDISTTTAGAWCSRMLAALGADVVVVEPPSGHPLRTIAPFGPDGTSIPAAYWLADKRSVTIDLDSIEGQATARRLAGRVDILVSSYRPSELAARRLRYADLGATSLIMGHVTPHGMDGPLAEVPGNDLTDAARSGWASINGNIDREPLKPAAWGSSMCAGIAASSAIVAALFHRDRHPGEGQEVDVAEVDVLAGMFAPALARSTYANEVFRRRDATDTLGGPVPVKDGHFALTLSRAHFWRDAMNLLGLPDLAEDPRWGASFYRQQHRDEYMGRVTEAMAQWDKAELFEELAVRRVVAGPVLTMAELAVNEHLRSRGFWVRPEGDPTAPEMPGAPFKASATPLALRHRAPGPGEHTAEVLRDPEASV